MGLILNLETSSTNCSVCVAKDGIILAIRELNSANYSHAEKLHVFIEEVIEEATIKMDDIEAIAVSKGPGSYTGLRIGVSAAKGLCYALGIPLISISTLKSMASQIVDIENNAVVVPVLDARRMEVYSAVFDHQMNQVRDTKAEIIDEHSFQGFLGDATVHFVGSGAEKIRGVLNTGTVIFHTHIVPSSKEMALLSFDKFKEQKFEDVAYFEPYYLKDFVLQTKKVSKT
ncbi:tRNA (adenosine(37)-N6)-threonylcarbamoyltransferase complex dimerization subunit type 1 TsaB [Maribacter confluentis]|uniref:tRNA (Adenosine(37)-N6)-threonylcarbamoyltransferase complex dimerization subunit type 1 TsaB n=1 Tax=Maribacter confluentis TaxID=1656093 RepID=A0ABT8RS29_9FLAO|nr:tRNA (adenosine(37)-N6)-threonylcarbamoyltransferase complex dimerization subunit type 1 TsaB [Maribacter confluentis]MDO1513505.1 tRNA (adenosine(37)-N6)-threonylcarbamoyltransferase complex dimerization subunit type 1 TsaB [Maribacter confluentis]